MLNEIKRSMRVGKLDSMFLLIPTIFGLSIAISSSLIRTEPFGVALIVICSVFMIAAVWPIYIGYVRGAIMDDILERARGWIYLIVGVLVYVWNMIVSLINASFVGSDMAGLILNLGFIVFGFAVIGSLIRHFPRKVGLRIVELAFDDDEYLTKHRKH